MQLDYVQGTFVLTCATRDAVSIRREHGFEVSRAAHNGQAVLFTKEPCAAVAFVDAATPLALAALAPLRDKIEASRAYDSVRHLEIPTDKEMWGFQRASTAYALDCHNALIADVPGLGKTVDAVVVSNEIQARRNLVICPATIRQQWATCIREWTTQDRPHIDVITSGRRSISLQAEWIVISYELARQPAISAALAQGSYDLLILDEAHYAKTGSADRTRAIFGGGRGRDVDPLAYRSAKILALTGTPLPNRPREAYVLTRGLCWDAIDWMSEDSFSARFNPYKRKRVGRGRFITISKEGRSHELQARLRGNFMVRHTKDSVVSQQIGRTGYPVYDLVHALETGPVKQALQLERLLDFDPDTFRGRDAKFDGMVATARRLMGVALAPQAASYVKMLLEGGEEKIVVFAWHTEVLDILGKELDAVRVDGACSPAQRAHAIERFIHDPGTQVIIGNTLALGTGVDGLQRVSCHAVIAEPDWTPGNNVQCFDRLDRGGQTRQVQGDIFVAPGSIAERILAQALRKMRTIHNALDDTPSYRAPGVHPSWEDAEPNMRQRRLSRGT